MPLSNFLNIFIKLDNNIFTYKYFYKKEGGMGLQHFWT